jgi:hypothetical protein
MPQMYLFRLGFIRHPEEFGHRLNLHVAVLQLPFVVLFHRTLLIS